MVRVIAIQALEEKAIVMAVVRHGFCFGIIQEFPAFNRHHDRAPKTQSASFMINAC
jgi:hypothetical protein